MTHEQYARASWLAWGSGWAMSTLCRSCGEMRYCRGKRRDRMFCLDCFDQGAMERKGKKR